ncbi:MAG: hypothetical protein IJN99_01720 [Clostridia bacterium]|nr:hypothetical protein [Clostridia bacterium]
MSKFICNDSETSQNYIFDKEQFALNDVVAHLVRLEIFLCCRDKLYFYNSDKGFFIPLPENEIWFYICRYVSRGVSECFEPKDIKKLIAKLKINLDLHFDSDKFDTYDDLININNGVLNVNTGKLIPKKCEYYFTSNIDAALLEDVSLDDCPTFKKFYETSLCGDEKSLTLLLQIIGYLCCNDSSAKKAFMFIGEKNCGKSKILEFISRLIGKDNVCNIPLHKLGNRFNVAELSRNKVNIQAELSLDPLREIETFKNAVGGDTLCGEYKGENLFYFKNKCKLLFAGNGVPALKTQDTTQAFVSRLIFLIFPKEIPVDERDPKLVDKLYAERDVIFSLAIKELLKLIQSRYKFEVPVLSQVRMNSFMEQNNQIDDFINEHCLFGSEYKVFSRDLYYAYKKFCKDNCLFAHSQTAFLDAVSMCEGVVRSKMRINGEQLRGFKGIGLNMQDSDVSYNNFADTKTTVPSVPERSKLL